jgi:hypothetical protein
MRRLRIAVLVPLVVGCSIMDPEDRAELRHQIAAMPRDKLTQMERWYMNLRAKKWLTGKDPNDQVGKVLCRDDEAGVWSGWYDRPNKFMTVQDMVDCLTKKSGWPTYVFCADEFASWVIDDAKQEVEKLLPKFTGVECKYVWDFRYEPEKVDPKAIDPDTHTADDYIDAMIALPGPPPGWVFPQFAPLLCPLGAGPGWGCPPSPSDTSPAGGEPTDPTGGDHP